MNEHPILFTPEMVRAIFDGRKTQTRRVIKPQPNPDITKIDRHGIEYPGDPVFGFATEDEGWKCPYGTPGDRLWVRETWQELQKWKSTDRMNGRGLLDIDREYIGFVYRADGEQSYKWRPSIHMPRRASRITLEVVDVRVERVQDISIDDVFAEGTRIPTNAKNGNVLIDLTSDKSPCPYLPPGELKYIPADVIIRAHFAALWDSINAKRGFGWDVNPWVWVVEFERVEP